MRSNTVIQHAYDFTLVIILTVGFFFKMAESLNWNEAFYRLRNYKGTVKHIK